MLEYLRKKFEKVKSIEDRFKEYLNEYGIWPGLISKEYSMLVTRIPEVEQAVDAEKLLKKMQIKFEIFPKGTAFELRVHDWRTLERIIK